jgi:hypothetical protein
MGSKIINFLFNLSYISLLAICVIGTATTLVVVTYDYFYIAKYIWISFVSLAILTGLSGRILDKIDEKKQQKEWSDGTTGISGCDDGHEK